MAVSPPIQDNELPKEAELEVKIRRRTTSNDRKSSAPNQPQEIEIHKKTKRNAGGMNDQTTPGNIGMITTPGSGGAASPETTTGGPAASPAGGRQRLQKPGRANSSSTGQPSKKKSAPITGQQAPNQTTTPTAPAGGVAPVSSTPTPERQLPGTPTQPSPYDMQSLGGADSTPTSGRKPTYSTAPQRNFVPQRGSSTGTRPSDTSAGSEHRVNATGPEDDDSQPVDLNRPEPVYDEPGIEDNFDDDETTTNPATNPAVEETQSKLGGKNKKDKTAPGRDELAGDEKAGADADKSGKPETEETDKLGRGFTGGGGKGDGKPSLGSKLGTALGGLLGTKRRKVIAGAFGGGITGLIIAMLIFILPLKILSMVENLEAKFLASFNHSAQKEAETVTSQYVRRRLAVIRNCKGGVVDANCNPISKLNPIERAYRGKIKRNFEETMAKKYNLTLRSDGAHYWINDINADEFVNGGADLDLSDWLQAKGRNDVRQQFLKAIENETGFKKVALRYKLGRYLEEVHGIRRCLFFCQARDDFADKVTAQKNAYKLSLSQRVLGPRDTMLKRLVDCFFNISGGCSLDPKPHECAEGVDCEQVGKALSDAEISIQTELRAKALKDFGFDTPAKIADTEKFAADAAEKGWTQKEIESFTADLTGKGTAADRIPLIGWAIMASQIVTAADHAGPTLKKLGYLANSTSAVALFSMYATTADECKSGHCDNNALGSLSASLDAQPDSKHIKGGTASALESPIYDNVTTGGPIKKSTNYKCDGGKAVLASGVCPEEVLGQGNAIFDTLHQALSTFPFNIIRDIAKVITSAVNAFFGLFGPLISAIFSGIDAVWCHKLPYVGYGWPGNIFAPYCEARDLIKENIPKIIDFIVNNLIPNPFGDTMSGARTFNMMAAGADVSGNDAVHSQMGGVQATPAQISALETEQRQKIKQAYFSQSFFARLLDTQSSYSPISKLAMATPSSVSSASATLANSVTNPFASLSSAFGSIFGRHASAVVPQPDAFGITQYFVPDEVYKKIGDQSKFWDEHCSDNPVMSNGQISQAYAAASTQHIDENTGMPVNVYDPNDPYLGVNPCALIQFGACEVGFLDEQDSCSAEDLGTDTDTSTGPDSTSTTTSVPSGSAQELAKGLLDRHYKGTINGHTYNGDGKYSCDNAGDCNDLDDTANGQSISGHGNCHVDAIGADVLQAVLILIEQKGYSLGTFALCSDHSETGHTRHTYGEAVDISTINGHAVNTDAAETDVTSILRVFNGLIGQPLAPDQLLNQGVGNHYIAANDALSMDNHQSSPYFTSKYVGDHEDHVHVGY